jgi:hypothetical protein
MASTTTQLHYNFRFYYQSLWFKEVQHASTQPIAHAGRRMGGGVHNDLQLGLTNPLYEYDVSISYILQSASNQVALITRLCPWNVHLYNQIH